MAGDWIKMSVNLPDKPEVWQIAGMIGIDADSVVGKLLRVWAWFDAHTENGNANGVTYTLVDRVAGVAGFAEAMALAGWLTQNGSIMSIPNFSRHNGKTAKNRALTNERVAQHRKSNDESNAESNADTVTESVTKTVTREEKRRSNTVAKATDAEASVPDAIWGDGLAYLVACGVKESGARSFIGKMRAELKNDLLVAELLMKAEKQQVADPVSWLRAASGRNLHSGRTSAGVAL